MDHRSVWSQWFWIEDRDIQSKQMFNFTAAPIVTIPAR